jgi:hypothetical protein
MYLDLAAKGRIHFETATRFCLELVFECRIMRTPGGIGLAGEPGGRPQCAAKKQTESDGLVGPGLRT